MNTNESTALAEKLQTLMATISKFGTESEQLKKVRDEFDQYLEAVKQTDVKMGEVIEKCNDYIETARELVERDLSEQVKVIVESTEESVKNCKEQCEKVTEEYKETLALFEGQKEFFEKQTDELSEAMTSGFEKAEESSNNVIASVKESVDVLLTNIAEVKTELEDAKARQMKDALMIKVCAAAAAVAALAAIIGLFV